MANTALVVSKQFEKAINEAVGDIEESIVVFVGEIYDVAVDQSPFITGYLRSNHRINIRAGSGQFSSKSSGTAKLEPAEKPKDATAGALDRHEEVRAEEMAKLSAFALGDIITIESSVPYLDDAERRHGFYAAAEAVAANGEPNIRRRR